MHCSTDVCRRRLPVVLASIVLLAGSGGVVAQAQADNQPPVISGSPAATVQVGSLYSFQPTASDPDGQQLVFSILNKPWWAGFSKTTGKLAGSPRGAGRWGNIQIRVSDGFAIRSLPAFSITAGSGGGDAPSTGNQAPEISGAPATSVQVGSPYSFQPVASDPEGHALRFSIVNKPWWASFSTSTGLLSGTPRATGRWGNIQIRASDGKLIRSLPAFAITASAPSANKPPVISGSPADAVVAGQAYSFKPSASDPDGGVLGFSIRNRPVWATFSTSTGQLTGSPASSHVGVYSNIIISVSDGEAKTSLKAFSITVVDASIGGATLSWTPPTQNTDGSSLSNLAGYRIHYGSSAGVLTHSIQVSNPGVTNYVIENLSPGTYYFAVTAFTSTGAESAKSNIASKVVR